MEKLCWIMLANSVLYTNGNDNFMYNLMFLFEKYIVIHILRLLVYN